MQRQIKALANQERLLREAYRGMAFESRTSLSARRELRRIGAKLETVRERHDRIAAQLEALSLRFRSKAELEANSTITRSLPTIPKRASFAEVLSMMMPRLATTPALLREEYHHLLEEGVPDPVLEVEQTLRLEVMAGLIWHSEVSPEDLTVLQECYLNALVTRLVRQAIRNDDMCVADRCNWTRV